MDGIDSILEMIDEKATEKIDAILKQAQEQKAAVIEAAEEKSKGIEEKILKAANQEYNSSVAKQEANAKLKAKYEILEAKESMLTEILEDAEKEIVKIGKGKKYESILTKLIVEGSLALNVDKIELVFPKGQQNLITPASVEKEIAAKGGTKVSISVSKDEIRSSGGVIIRLPDGSKFVDNTFESRLERFHSDIRDKISTILFHE